MTVAALSIGALGTAHAQAGPDRAASSASQAARDARAAREARLALWKDSFDAFAEADRQHAPKPGGVLFVGSSSIRLWEGLADDFRSVSVVTQRGFGGSRLSDCAEQVDRLVLPYKPAVVVLYAGDNDLAEGATPREVLASFRSFVEAVHDGLPNARIAYVSIKPSPLRATLMPQVVETNALIEAYATTAPHLDYIDVYSKMLRADGRPRTELFAPDMLHLNRAGYAMWSAEISGHLQRLAEGVIAPTVKSPEPPARGAR